MGQGISIALSRYEEASIKGCIWEGRGYITLTFPLRLFLGAPGFSPSWDNPLSTHLLSTFSAYTLKEVQK